MYDLQLNAYIYKTTNKTLHWYFYEKQQQPRLCGQEAHTRVLQEGREGGREGMDYYHVTSMKCLNTFSCSSCGDSFLTVAPLPGDDSSLQHHSQPSS